MQRSFLIGLVLLILVGASLFLYVNRPPTPSGAPELTSAAIEATTTNYTVDAQYPQFGIPAIDTQIKSDVEKGISDFEALPSNPPGSATQQNSFTGRFDKTYIGPDVVSTELILSQYTGGAHDITAFVGENYDRDTGIALTLDDALRMSGLSLQEVAASSTAQLRAKFGDAIFADGATADPKNYSSFVISKTAITFIFQEYQVASYAAGVQYISFPRKQ